MLSISGFPKAMLVICSLRPLFPATQLSTTFTSMGFLFPNLFHSQTLPYQLTPSVPPNYILCYLSMCTNITLGLPISIPSLLSLCLHGLHAWGTTWTLSLDLPHSACRSSCLTWHGARSRNWGSQGHWKEVQWFVHISLRANQFFIIDIRKWWVVCVNGIVFPKTPGDEDEVWCKVTPVVGCEWWAAARCRSCVTILTGDSCERPSDMRKWVLLFNNASPLIKAELPTLLLRCI